MHKIQSVLDLSRVQGLSVRKVTTRLGLKRSTVSDCRMESMVAALSIQRSHPHVSSSQMRTWRLSVAPPSTAAPISGCRNRDYRIIGRLM